MIMKKLFTLLFCTGMAGASFAQGNRDAAANVILHPKTVSYPAGSNCQEQINAINRTYDGQVASIRNNALLSAADRDLKIRQTEQARRYKIRQIQQSCGGTTPANGVKKAKSNNGNHYGWEKGKGNPHKGGGKGNGKGKD
jgi:hypothetical protein